MISTMISNAFRLVLLLMIARGSIASAEHIFRIKSNGSSVQHEDIYPLYDSHNENAALLSRELELLQQTIDAIRDDTCRSECRSVLIGLRDLTGWAVKFYDATEKIPTGVLAGSVYQLGNFDECLNVGLDDGAPAGIRGRYCLGEVDVEVPEIYLAKNGSIWEAFRDTEERYREPIRKLYWGICLPAGCATEDIEEVARRILDAAFGGSRLKLTVTMSEMSCYKDEFEPIGAPDIVYMCVILSVILMILSGTVFHTVCLRNQHKTSDGILPKILISFSLISNLKKLFSPAHIDNLHIDCIAGIKFISMVFILVGHSLIFIMSGPMLDKKFNDEAVTKIENSIFLNNPLLVDTFLMLSGFLFCRILLQELDKRKSVNFLHLYVIRYFRLTPAYSVILGLYATWLTQLDRGPRWSIMRHEKKKCLSSWWTNLLYVNNYVNTDKICMFQSWYLAVDTQLFILAPAIIYPLWRWRKIGKCLLVGATAISIAIPFAITLFNNLDPTLMIYSREIKDITTNHFFASTYIKTHMRAESYCIGLMFGYGAYRLQAGKHQLCKKIIKFGWLFATLSLLVSMFSITIFYNVRRDFTVIEAAIYSPLHRLLWCTGIGWILIASITNNAGPIRNFLRYRVFIILSRVTYSAYLVNGLVELHSAATLRTPQHLNNFQLLRTTLSHVMLTFGGAIVLSTMFESPILSLERTFLQKDKQNTGT
ncbi:nose resistant to fluoxetine protein 6-like isoform X1 [Odontomachus brunneus]|uniref:nose resistant to fluoxetine protein 6-like isoform X1 n=1 Tax=Odontomachus brunneus TaxID=486640 RepID=UPI0013F1BF2A|nr:nose resistant to fluoxetine protein 6-like isoform X1 [Odontomachus brunneus]XP_032678636.1 nose resistant to fluoxetine protein 6-like isoform X1 [Odontomachus brunneus]